MTKPRPRARHADGAGSMLVASGIATILAVAAFFVPITPRTAVDRDQLPPAVAKAPASHGTSGIGPVVEIRWRSISRATLYNVVLWRDGERTLDMWPRRAAIRIPKHRLAPGVYQWFVYPWLGTSKRPTYGRVLAHGKIKA